MVCLSRFYSKAGDTTRFSEFGPGVAHLITAQIVDSGPLPPVPPDLPHQPVMSFDGVESTEAPAHSGSHTVEVPTVDLAHAHTGGYPLVSVIDPSIDAGDAVKALHLLLMQRLIPAVVFASVDESIPAGTSHERSKTHAPYTVHRTRSLAHSLTCSLALACVVCYRPAGPSRCCVPPLKHTLTFIFHHVRVCLTDALTQWDARLDPESSLRGSCLSSTSTTCTPCRQGTINLARRCY